MIRASVVVVHFSLIVFAVAAAPSHVRAESYLSSRCSLKASLRPRDPEVTYFVGFALRDTARAGMGATRPYGRRSSGKNREVYGQLVRVDTIGGAGVARVREALERRKSQDVLVVPWAYDPACEPMLWYGSARWIDPGSTDFYMLQLRPVEHWADGIPTFDAFYASFEYGPVYQPSRSLGAFRDRSLNAREMFSFYGALPVWSTDSSERSAGRERLRAWAAQNPELARKSPARELLESLLRQ